MRFSPDGTWLVGPGPSIEPGTLRVWDASSGKLLRSWSAHAFAITTLAVSPRGDLVASAGAEAKGPDGAHPLADITVKLWDASSGAAVATLTGLAGEISSVAFSPSGDRLVTADRGGLVRLWTVPDGSVVRDLASPPAPTSSLTVNSYGKSAAFSPDGQWVAAAGVDWTLARSPRGDIGHSGVISIWSVADGRPRQRRLVSLSEGNLGWIAWSPTGKALAAGTRSGARIWCLEDVAGTPPVAR
jgi:WD40 repeat protein